MPQMSHRKKLLYHANRAKASIERTLEHLHAVDVEADGKSPAVKDSIDSLVLMGITYINVLKKFRESL